MPLISQNPNGQAGLVKAASTADTPQPVNSVRIANPAYKGIVQDMRWQNRADLLTYAAGSIWVLEYFSQVLNTDSQLSGVQLSVDSPYQQYKCIKDLKVRVTAPLTTSQVDDSKGMEMVGTAILPPSIIPNEGDMFAADLGEGIRGIFRVTLTTKKSIYKQACYEIEYSLDTDENDKYDNLQSKTVQTLFYREDFLNYGRDPLIVSELNDALMSLSRVYEALTEQYFNKFLSKEYMTLIVPGQTLTTYDAYLVDFLLSQFDTTECPQLRQIRQLNLGDNKAGDVYCIWDALKKRDPSYLDTAFKQVGRLRSSYFYSYPLVNTIRYSGIDAAVYPMDVQYLPQDLDPTQTPVVVYPLDKPVPRLYQMAQTVNTADVDGPTPGSFSSVMVDDYYVLRQQFYEKSQGMNTLEGVVWEYLERKPMDPVQILETVKGWASWSLLDQFYCIPVFMHLLRSILRGDA